MQRAVGIVFIASWLLCGCSMDQMFDDWRAAVITVVALIVTIVCTAVLASGKD